MRKGMKRGVSFERQLSGAEIALTTVAKWPQAVAKTVSFGTDESDHAPPALRQTFRTVCSTYADPHKNL